MAQAYQPPIPTQKIQLLAQQPTAAELLTEKFNTAQDSNKKCDEAKANIKTLSTFDKIQYTDNARKVNVLNEIEKTQQLEISKKQEEVYCKVL